MKIFSIKKVVNKIINSMIILIGFFQLFILWLRQKNNSKSDYSDFLQMYKKCRLYTMTEDKKLMNIYSAVKYINKNNISGDFVECGVWRGGCCMLMALTQLKYETVTDKRKIYLYDTFNGMPKPGKNDPWFSSLFNGLGVISLEEVKKNMLSTKYPAKNTVFVKGDILQTIPSTELPEKISLLRLDTDYYASTKHELEQLFPLLVQGGVLMIDDYYSFNGARKAVDEYMEQNNININFKDVVTGIIAYKE